MNLIGREVFLTVLHVSRVFAIDWSGDRRNARRKIWLAEAADGRLLRVEAGRTREAIADVLLEEARRDDRFVVGLDFAFSFPASFCARLDAASVTYVWNRAAAQGEHWLAQCALPFWGKPGRRRGALADVYRRTELAVAGNGSGAKPKSIFQIGGAGAVGAGSLRGMPLLKRLHESGFSVWPFDPVQLPLVVEIYPRLLTGPVNKSSRAQRESYLADRHPDLSPDHGQSAASCEDAFDAAVSALEMCRRLDGFTALCQTIDPTEIIEGRIWY